MQLGNSGSAATVSGTVGKPTGFKMSATKTSFDIMSNGIYNDKIRAVIRELACNCVDSHVAAGKPNTPFEVHLPTQFEPYFSINDFGTGLRFVAGGCEVCNGAGGDCETCNGTGDYDGVLRLHSTYFASDKNQSNDMIGGFGLGSKSPFAYTNKRLASGEYQSGGFTVINRFNGVTYTYSAFVNDGLPDCVMMAKTDTPSAPNGVEVTFPVESKDIWEFENKAAIVFEFFDPQPRMNKAVDVNMATYSVRTPLWGMRQNGGGLRAIMGHVQYSVGNIDLSRLSPSQVKMVNMPIDLFFNIGDLNPAVSRETLQLDEKTITNILKSLDVVQGKLMDEVRKKIDACPSLWEARLKIYELTAQDGVGGMVSDAFSKGMLFGDYGNFKLEDTNLKINELDYHSIVMLEFRHNDRAKAKAKKEVLFTHTDSHRRQNAFRDIAAGISKKTEFDIKLEVDRKVVFILNDLNIKSPADKYVHFMLQNDPTNVFKKALVIQRSHKHVAFDRAMTEATGMLDTIGNPPMVKMSDLKAKYDPEMRVIKNRVVIKRERRGIRVLKSYPEYGRRGTTGWKKQWNSSEGYDDIADPSITKYYIVTDPYGELAEPLGYHHGANFVTMVNTMKSSGFFPELTEVYGLKQNSPLLNDPAFQPLMPFLKARIQGLITPALEAEMCLTTKPFSTDWMGILTYIAEHHQVLSVTSPIRQFAMMLAKAEAGNKENHSTIAEVARLLSVNINITADFNVAWKNTLKHYPMLKFVRRSMYGSATMEECTTMVDYIRWADEQRKRLVLSDVTVVEEEEETANV